MQPTPEETYCVSAATLTPLLKFYASQLYVNCVSHMDAGGINNGVCYQGCVDILTDYPEVRADVPFGQICMAACKSGMEFNGMDGCMCHDQCVTAMKDDPYDPGLNGNMCNKACNSTAPMQMPP